VAQIDVVLQDFDGSRTIFPASLPLRDVIHSAQSDMVVTINKAYVRTDEKDEDGRTIYVERK